MRSGEFCTPSFINGRMDSQDRMDQKAELTAEG